MMGLSWGALAGSFLAPFLYGLWWKRTSKASVWVSFAFGCVNMCLNMFVPSIYPAWLKSPINCGAFTMLVGLVIAPTLPWETDDGFRTNVIFPGGMIAEDDGSVKIYYGASDTVECLATSTVEDLVALCTEKP